MSWKLRVTEIDDIVKTKNNWNTIETVRFLALSIAGEAGELANEVKKEWRINGGRFWTDREFDAYNERLRMELADIHMLTYRLQMELGIDIDEACEKKITILDERWKDGIK